MKRTSVRISATALAIAVTACLTIIPGQAQREDDRYAGPRDWSHGRVVATRFGPDQGRQLKTNWRTFMKHAQLDRASARRNATVDPSETLQRLELEHSQAAAGLDSFTSDQARRPALDWFKTEQERLERKEREATSSLVTFKIEQKLRQLAERPHLDWSLKTGGYGSVVGYPAKFSFDITASNCSDDVYFTVDQPGSASAVNVVGLTNVYAGCSGNATGATPTVKFGIRMGTGTATSAVPSLDGKILYVFESSAGGVILHAINVDMIITNPGTYNFSTLLWSNAHTLATAPIGTTSTEQLFQIPFPSTVVNNLASPFLDYDTNQIFFGDSAGKIHRVINVNLASASRDLAKFPVACGTRALQSPVFVNGQVIATSADGRVYRINTTLASPYTCIASSLAGTGTGAGGGASPPVVDVSNGKIFVASNDAAGFGLSGIGTFDLMFASNAVPTSSALLGALSANAPTAPSFDDAFWSTNNGNIYAVGSPQAGGNTYLVRVPYNGTTLGTAAGYAALFRSGTASNVATSPVTEFLTASVLSQPDFIFVGGGGGNYKYMNRIGSGFNGGDTAPVGMANNFLVPGGVISGIVIDTRTAGVTGSMATANIYFGTVGIASSVMSTIVQLAQQF